MSLAKAAGKLDVGQVEKLLREEDHTDEEKNGAVLQAAAGGERFVKKHDDATFAILTALKQAGASFQWEPSGSYRYSSVAIIKAKQLCKPKTVELLETESPTYSQMAHELAYDLPYKNGDGFDSSISHLTLRRLEKKQEKIENNLERIDNRLENLEKTMENVLVELRKLSSR